MTSALDPAALLEALPDLVVVIDAHGSVSFANKAARELLGIPEGGTTPDITFGRLHPDDLPVVLSSIEAVAGKAAGTPIEVRVSGTDGRWHLLEIVGADGSATAGVDGIVCVGRDLTRRRMWEVAASDVTRFQHVLQHASAVILLLDGDGRITSVNGAFTRLLGHDPTAVVGRHLADFVTDDDRERLTDSLSGAGQGHRVVHVEVMMAVAPRGEHATTRPIRWEIVDLLDDPFVSGLVVSGHDVSDLHHARLELEFMARHDHLTGLANRSVLVDHLDEIVREGRSAAVVFLDLDGFKTVNDRFGHDAGDELLQMVAHRLKSESREDDLVARVGGDEFVVVAHGVTSRETATHVAERLVASVSESFSLRAGSAQISASAGYALSEPGVSAADLLARADRWMYHDKARSIRSAPRALQCIS